MKMTAQEYARRVKKVGPHSPLGTDCLWAFGVGGGICLHGEVLRQRYLALGGKRSGQLRGFHWFHWIGRSVCRIHAEHFCGLLLLSPASPGC